MRNTQDFLVRVVSDRTISGEELLNAILGVGRLPEDIKAIDCGDAANAPDVYADALKRYAETRGLKLVEVPESHGYRSPDAMELFANQRHE